MDRGRLRQLAVFLAYLAAGLLVASLLDLQVARIRSGDAALEAAGLAASPP